MDVPADEAEATANFLFWSTEIKKGGITTLNPGNPDDALHITMACFGETVDTGSRSVLYAEQPERGVKGPIAVLTQGVNENQCLDLMLSGGESLRLSIRGESTSSIFLSGYIQPMIDADELKEHAGIEFTPGAEVDKESENLSTIGHSLQPASSSLHVGSGVKRPSESVLEADEPPKKKMKEKEESVEEKADESKSKSQEPKEEEKEAEEPSKESPPVSAPVSPKKHKKKKKFTYDKDNVGIRVAKKGSGKVVEKGDEIHVRYIGQLADSKTIFDKNLGEGFRFVVGEGTCIKGWEQGVIGMKEGEKRKILVPPEMGYGNVQMEDIPPNSELLFTCELLEVIKGGSD